MNGSDFLTAGEYAAESREAIRRREDCVTVRREIDRFAWAVRGAAAQGFFRAVVRIEAREEADRTRIEHCLRSLGFFADYIESEPEKILVSWWKVPN
jgi:hypothetical protein